MFGYPALDAGLNTSWFVGDIAFSDSQNRPRLSKACLRHFKSKVIKPLDKTSFQLHNLFCTMKTYAMNAHSSIIQKFLKSIAI